MGRSGGATIKVVVVDDHELVRTGISRILADVPGIEVVGEAGTGEQALELVRRIHPDVVLMDVNMPGIGGLEASCKLQKVCPEVRIIAVTVYEDGPIPTRLLQAGVAGYLTKGCAAEEIIHAIRTVHAGQRYVGAQVAQGLALNALPGAGGTPLERLSQRELQVMLMVVQGYKTQDISDKLCLSPKTVSTYRYRIFEKLGVASDVELTHLALRYGLMEPDAQARLLS